MPTEPSLVLAIILSGLALGFAGAGRLVRVWLPRMPAAVAALVVVAGLAVTAFGAVAALVRPAPAIGLHLTREPDAASPAPVSEAVASIHGTVRRASGDPVAGAGATLSRFDRTELAEKRETTTGPDGRFSFESLAAGPTIAYTVATDFEGTAFRSGLVVFPPGGGDQAVDLAVAPTTQDESVITLPVDSTVLVGDRHGLEVLQIVTVRNTSDHAFVGGLRLPLLPRATGVDPRQGLDRTRLVLDSGELVSMAPVMPGATEVIYTYAVPNVRSGVAIRRSIHYATGRYALLVGRGLALDAAGMRRDGRVRLDSDDGPKTYERFSRADASPGQTLRATVSVAAAGPWRARGAAAAGAIAFVVLAYPLARRRRTPGTAPAEDAENAASARA